MLAHLVGGHQRAKQVTPGKHKANVLSVKAKQLLLKYARVITIRFQSTRATHAPFRSKTGKHYLHGIKQVRFSLAALKGLKWKQLSLPTCDPKLKKQRSYFGNKFIVICQVCSTVNATERKDIS